MQKRRLGRSDMELTTVGQGTWAIGGGKWEFSWGPQEDKEAVQAIRAGLEEGINWIDTAAVYGLGHSEELIGRALKHSRYEPFIATKCGLLWDKRGSISNCLEPDSIRQECEASLRRLDVDVIDLYQMHWPRPDSDIEKGWEQMARLAEQGKVRYIGISNFTVEQIERVGRIYPVTSLQPPYSMIKRDAEEELLPYCKKHNIGVVAYSPMERGLLTGKFSHERLSALSEDDHRRRQAEFQESRFSATLELVEKLRPIAQRNNFTLPQLAIAWVLRREEVTAAIVGARRPSQIKETAKASEIALCDEDIREIDELIQQRRQRVQSG